MTETRQEKPTYFSLIGGAPAVDRLVEAFYVRMDAEAGARSPVRESRVGRTRSAGGGRGGAAGACAGGCGEDVAGTAACGA